MRCHPKTFEIAASKPLTERSVLNLSAPEILQRPAPQPGAPLFGAQRPERPRAPANPGSRWHSPCPNGQHLLCKPKVYRCLYSTAVVSTLRWELCFKDILALRRRNPFNESIFKLIALTTETSGLVRGIGKVTQTFTIAFMDSEETVVMSLFMSSLVGEDRAGCGWSSV